MSGKGAKAERLRLRREMEAAAAGPALWHGGPDGLTVGTVLRPLTTLLRLPASARMQHDWYDDLEHCHVNATTDRILARDYAARWTMVGLQGMTLQLTGGKLPPRNPWAGQRRIEGGTLYRVQPLGELSRDPDYPEGVSFRMPSARIIAVEESVPWSDVPSPEVLHYQRWEGGRRIYDDHGHALVNSDMEAYGITDADLRSLGYAPPAEKILAHVNAVLNQRHRRP